MKTKNFLLAGLLFLFASVVATSCGKDDDDDAPKIEDTSAIAGEWLCTDADVESISSEGFELPDIVMNMFKDQLENDLEGSTINIDPKKVKYDGKVLLFSDSGISWKILSLTSKEMVVRYDTESAYGGMKINITVKAEYEKVK